MTTVDYLVVGSGLTGSTIARCLHDQGREVLVLERRRHRGGNVHDFTTENGLRVHTYGPHYFRCSSPRIWEFVGRFAEFYPFAPIVQCRVQDRFESWPVNRQQFEAFPGWEKLRPTRPPENFEDACLQKMPRPVYERFIEGYTRRQWGVPPKSLDAALADRIRINEPHEKALTPQHRHQVLPRHGYAHMMDQMLHEIPCQISVDFLQQRHEFQARKALIFTGPIDEFFGFDLGRLRYRGQRRVHQTFPQPGPLQPCPQVNYPNAPEHDPIRTIEWRHLAHPKLQTDLRETVVTGEFPFSPTDPDQFEYPFPDAENRHLYELYRERAKTLPNLLICGRLGEYRYFDMDQAIGRALMLAQGLIEKPA